MSHYHWNSVWLHTWLFLYSIEQIKDWSWIPKSDKLLEKRRESYAYENSTCIQFSPPAVVAHVVSESLSTVYIFFTELYKFDLEIVFLSQINSAVYGEDNSVGRNFCQKYIFLIHPKSYSNFHDIT